jgi:hypothetical protein
MEELMRRMLLIGGLAAASALGACQERARPDARLCTPFVPAAAPATAPGVAPAPADPAAPLDACLHRWGYALAGSTDEADVVAEAAISACSASLSAWNRQSVQPSADGRPAAPTEAMSLTTGEPVNVFTAHHNFAQNRALFWVVQARAGKCGPPPMEKGMLKP